MVRKAAIQWMMPVREDGAQGSSSTDDAGASAVLHSSVGGQRLCRAPQLEGREGLENVLHSSVVQG